METEQYIFEQSAGHRRKKEGNKKFLSSNKNENTTYQNVWDAGKGSLRRKFIAVSAHIKKSERSQINKLIMYLKLSENQEQAKLKSTKK
jgi:hypothetical protein